MLPAASRVLGNARPLGFAANVNRGVARTAGEHVLTVNPTRSPSRGAVAALAAFMDAHPRCGVAGPRMVYPDGTWQPSRRRSRPCSGRSCGGRRCGCCAIRTATSERHYNLDERPAEPVQADWMLGGFLLLRRAMLDELGGFDEGFRIYGEDIDLCYRAAQAGWERWYVPAAVVEHEHKAETDRGFLTRRTLWHWRGILRFVRKHPERLRAL